MAEQGRLYKARMAWYRFKPRRWLIQKCSACGQRFGYREAHFANGNRDGQTFHNGCLSAQTWRRKADERLAVLDLIVEVWDIDSLTVQTLMANRVDKDSHNASNLAWRVFYDLEKRRADPTPESVTGGASGGAS